ncbi:MAG: TerB family tellurite resistance protein [Deltaproteobacteria bacterium]|nr:TerB family tellurite resistance protein [Deltaproteobacteria bacterium]
MFIGLLNKEQQEALCSIIQFVAKIDGADDAREELLISALLAETSLDTMPATADDQDAVEALLDRFDTPVARHSLLLEMMGVALADNNLHEAEVKAILAVADALKVDREWVDRGRDYVQRTLELQREGNDLLRG